MLKIKDNYIDVEELKKGLEFNHEFGIYVDIKTNEKFCPTCLTDKKRKNHLQEQTTDFGTVYSCRICPQIFRDKEFLQRVEKANRNRSFY